MLVTGNKIINRYEIIKHIGSGGMGDVYLVIDNLLNHQKLALKLLKADFLKKEGSKERFLREVELARQATHSNVLRTFDVGEDTEHGIYFTMEYADGKNLATLLEQGAIKYQQAIIIIGQLLSGLEEIHHSNIVHRDLKPSNIIINQDGLVQIMDFGIARSGDSQLTISSEVLGSGPYMSPEQWKGGTVTARTDLYGVGVILFELLTGIQPFQADTAPQQMYKHLVEMPEPKLCKPDLPSWLNQLTVSLLAKESMDRPSSATEVLQIIKDKISVDKLLASFQLGAGGKDIIFEERGREDCFTKVNSKHGYWTKATGISLAMIILISMGFASKSILQIGDQVNPSTSSISDGNNSNALESLSESLAPKAIPTLERPKLEKSIIKNKDTNQSPTRGTYNKVEFKNLEKFPKKEEYSNPKLKAESLAQKNQQMNPIASRLKMKLQQMSPEERQNFFKK